MRILPALAISVFVSFGPAVGQEFKGPPWFSAERCNRKDAVEADKYLDRLTNWTAVHRTFKRYRQCDDGGLAEGYSDKIANLLTRRWSSVGTLWKLTQSDRKFEQFVLLHVDSLMSADDARLLIDNARNRCPAGVEKLCRSLEEKAKKPE